MDKPFEIGARVVDLHDNHGEVVGYYRDNISVQWDAGGTSCAPISHGGLRPEPRVYPTREAYARELWASLSDDDKADTLWQNDVTEADDEFFAFWTDNIDARNNGTVTFTRVEGGYTVDDEAVL